MGREGPETRLTNKMRKDGREKYGPRLVIIKYHGDNMSESGISDFIGTLDGVFFAIEAKAPNNYKTKGQPDPIKACKRGPTPKQRAFLMRVRDAGGCWSVVASREQFLETLEAIESHTLGDEFPAMPWLDMADFPGGTGVTCTCNPKYGCEWDTAHGCTYCRTAPRSVPCPNIEGGA